MDISTFIQEYWSYLTIPIVSAFVGYGTNWLAVKMMMYPINFEGVGAFGWQGVIPANAEKMARVIVDHSLKRVMTQEELIDRLEPDELVRALNHRLEPFVEEIVDELMAETSNYGLHVGNFFWRAAPSRLKDKVYHDVKMKLPDVVARIVDNMKYNAGDLLDINEVIVKKLTQNKELLVEIFQKAGKDEFKFIERSGFYFGFPLGIPVMFIWYYFPVWWLLPLFGLLVGYITNMLAIYLVQKPIEPVKIGPFRVQGLFIKRQKEVSGYFGQVFADQLLTAEVMAKEVLATRRAVDYIHELIHREVNHAIEASQGLFKPLTVISMGPKQYARMGDIVTERTFGEIHIQDKRSFRYINEVLDIEDTLTKRLGELPGEEFFELLHPIFEEEEWKLVLVGAALGFGAGWLQWVLLT